MVDAVGPDPIPHARVRTAFPGREIGGWLLARLVALADPSGRSRPPPRPAPTGRAETSVVLADGRRTPAGRASGSAGVY